MDGSMTGKTILDVKSLTKTFGGKKGLFKKSPGTVKAVSDVTFSVEEREILGLVGESGCGKTTLGRCIVRALDPTSGNILYSDPAGEKPDVDFASLSRRELGPYRLDIQMIFQDPVGSLNPRMTLLEIIGEPMVVNGLAKGAEVKKRVGELLVRVGLRAEHMNRYPHAFSGGQRQRIGIARALALDPKIIVCDEPVSALDVSVQAQVLNLLQDLREKEGLTFLFIAHDLGVVEYICDRVAVMYVGQIVEMTTTEELFERPLHPYTEALMSAVPVPDPGIRTEPQLLKGDPANAVVLPKGCHFHPRCAYCIDKCKSEPPTLRELAPGHTVRCHRAEELQLVGVAGAPEVANV